MMVIQRTSNKTGDTTIFPADKCTWQQIVDADSGLVIENVWFYPGGSGMYLSVASASVLLGHIGKSGRFVAMSN